MGVVLSLIDQALLDLRQGKLASRSSRVRASPILVTTSSLSLRRCPQSTTPGTNTYVAASIAVEQAQISGVM
jgi:hypothetical protein